MKPTPTNPRGAGRPRLHPEGALKPRTFRLRKPTLEALPRLAEALGCSQESVIDQAVEGLGALLEKAGKLETNRKPGPGRGYTRT